MSAPNVSSSKDSPIVKVFKHLVDNIESLFSIVLGLLVIFFSKDIFGMSTKGSMIGLIAIIAAVWSGIELVKQLFGEENAFWKIVSVIALVFSLFFAFLAMAMTKTFVPFDLSFILNNNGLIMILAYVEIGQSIFWLCVNWFNLE